MPVRIIRKAIKVMYNEVAKKATLKYMKEKMKVINIRIKKDDYEQRIQPAIKKSGLPMATFIKRAMDEKIDRDGLL